MKLSATKITGKDVIFVSNALANGGAARVLCLLANRFVEDGYEVGVIAFNPYTGEFPLNQSVSREYGPTGAGPLGKARRIRWIREVAQRNPNARLIAFEYFVNMLTLIACTGLPNTVVVSERNDPARVGNGFPTGFLRSLLYRKANALVCQTDEAAAYFSHKIAKQVILNPIKPDLPKVGLIKRRPTVVTFCRLERQKNLQMLIDAFAEFHRQHPEYTLEIYGDGRERSNLIAQVRLLGIEECVSISPARHDIHEIVKDCAMFALPSDYEGLSNSMIEAMALGLPTICTECPCGGAAMIIDHGRNGILVPVGDQDALAAAMDQIASDNGFAQALSHNAAKIREQLSLEVVARKWESVTFGDGIA